MKVHNILKFYLRKKKVCERFVPALLSDKQKNDRMEYCRDIVRMSDTDENFLETVVTGDTWCFQCEQLILLNPISNSENSELPEPRQVGMQSNRIMLAVYFDLNGLIFVEFLPENQTMNTDYYLGMLTRLLANIRRLRPQYRKEIAWSLLHKNTAMHRSKVVQNFLAEERVTQLYQPPYSPDLAPYDFFLFPRLRRHMENCQYHSTSAAQTVLFDYLKLISKPEYEMCFDDLYNRSNCCIDLKGMYLSN